MQTPPGLRAFRPESETYEDYRKRYHDSLPDNFQHLVCECSHAEKKQHEARGGKWTTYENGIVRCGLCGNYMSLWTYLEICFNCEEMYVVKVCPDQMLLCEDCGG